MNALQLYLSGLYVGDYSVKTLQADGVGGAPTTQRAGLVTGLGTVTHTSLPNPVTGVLAGSVAQGTVARAWAVVRGDGTFLRGFKVFSVQKNGTGDYSIVFDTAPADTDNPAVFAAVTASYFGPTSISTIPFASGGNQGLRVLTFAGSAATDFKFSAGFFAE